jgi:hypothetical protein
MGSSHSSGPSSYEIAAKQAKAEKAEKERIAAEKASKIDAANASAAGGEATGGKAEPYDGGALALKRKRTSTLAGEGEQTFGGNGSLGG